MRRKSVAILAIFVVASIGQMLGAFQVVPLLAYISIPLGILGIMLVAATFKSPSEGEDQ